MRGGGGGQGGERTNLSLHQMQLYACSFTLCLSFSYLPSAVAASLDIKSSTGTLQLSKPSYVKILLNAGVEVCRKFFFLDQE